MGTRGVEAPFGKDKEIIEDPERRKRSFIHLKESARAGLFFFSHSIPSHSTENLHICNIVLECHVVRKYCGIMWASVEKFIPRNKTDEAVIFNNNNNKAGCLCLSCKLSPPVAVAPSGGRVRR